MWREVVSLVVEEWGKPGEEGREPGRGCVLVTGPVERCNDETSVLRDLPVGRIAVVLFKPDEVSCLSEAEFFLGLLQAFDPVGERVVDPLPEGFSVDEPFGFWGDSELKHRRCQDLVSDTVVEGVPENVQVEAAVEKSRLTLRTVFFRLIHPECRQVFGLVDFFVFEHFVEPRAHLRVAPKQLRAVQGLSRLEELFQVPDDFRQMLIFLDEGQDLGHVEGRHDIGDRIRHGRAVRRIADLHRVSPRAWVRIWTSITIASLSVFVNTLWYGILFVFL